MPRRAHRAMPRAAGGLEVHEAADGFVVYDAAHDRVHQLTPTALAVLELCDGSTTIADIARLLGEAYGLARPPRADVAACIDALREQALVDG